MRFTGLSDMPLGSNNDMMSVPDDVSSDFNQYNHLISDCPLSDLQVEEIKSGAPNTQQDVQNEEHQQITSEHTQRTLNRDLFSI